MTVSVVFHGVRNGDGAMGEAFDHYGAEPSRIEIIYGDTRLVLGASHIAPALPTEPRPIGDCIVQKLAAGDGVATIVHAGARAICHITRATGDAPSPLRDAALHADLLIFGGAWQHGLRYKQALGARLLAITDHPADRTDADLAATAAEVAARHPNVFFARSGCTLDL